MGHQWQWTWGRDPTQRSALVYENETEEQGNLRAWQQSALIQTFWRLGSQFVPVKERVPRALWRDSRRKGIEHRDVNIMLLRRAKPSKEHDHDTGRTMKVRSITSGHWRNQHYKHDWVRPIWMTARGINTVKSGSRPSCVVPMMPR